MFACQVIFVLLFALHLLGMLGINMFVCMIDLEIRKKYGLELKICIFQNLSVHFEVLRSMEW